MLVRVLREFLFVAGVILALVAAIVLVIALSNGDAWDGVLLYCFTSAICMLLSRALKRT